MQKNLSEFIDLRSILIDEKTLSIVRDSKIEFC